MGRGNRVWFFAAAAAVAFSSFGGTAYAAQMIGPGESRWEIPQEYTPEQWDKLMNSQVEYSEIPALIKEFNPNIQIADQAFDNAMFDVENQALAAYKMEDDFRDDIEELEESGALATMEGQIMYATLNAYADAMGSTGDTISYSLKQAKREDSSSYREIKNARKLLTNGAEQVMIGYNMAASQLDTLHTMCDMYQMLYDATLVQQEQGMAVTADVHQAKANLIAAENSLMSLENTVESLETTFLQLVGWTTNEENRPEIIPIPEVDLQSLNAYDLESDIQKAIGNNQTLITKRRTPSGGSTTGIQAKRREVEQDEQLIAAQMQKLYDHMFQKKAAYETACMDYERAEIMRDAGEIQYQNGSMGQIAYLGQQLAYQQAIGAKRTANLELFQAMETYRWAVAGLLEY